MSLQITTSLHQGGSAGRTGFTANLFWTIAAWYRHVAAQDFQSTVMVTKGAGTKCGLFVPVGPTSDALKFEYSGSDFTTQTCPLVDATWYYLMATGNDLNVFTGYARNMDGSDPITGGGHTPFVVGTRTDSSVNPTKFSIGDLEDDTNCALGCYRYARIWIGTELSAADMLAEMGSATPVKAGCTAAWALPDSSTTTDTTGNGNTATIFTGVATSAQEPTLLISSTPPDLMGQTWL